MNRKIAFGKVAIDAMYQGIELLYDATRITLGPKGRNVIIGQEYGYPIIVNDGATIAKSLFIDDPYQNMGAQMVIHAAEKTNDQVGDGTTTSIILTTNLIKAGLKQIEQGINPRQIQDGLKALLPNICDNLLNQAIKINDYDDLAKIAYISSNSLSISQMIKDAYQEIGLDGIITLEESSTNYSSLEVVKGYFFERGYISNYLVSDNAKNQAVLDNPYLLITNKKITSINEIYSYIEYVNSKHGSLVMIVDEIESDAISHLIINKLRGTLNCVVVKAPGYGDKKQNLFHDLATISGARFIDLTRGDDFNIDANQALGQVKKAIISKDQTIIISNKNVSDLENYLLSLKAQINTTKSSYEKQVLTNRLAKLQGGIAIIKVGARSETEAKDLYLRYQDAINAASNSLKQGIIGGGGMALYQVAQSLKSDNPDHAPALAILADALICPFNQILENAAADRSLIIPLLKPGLGYDALSNQVVNLIESGIIDPVSTVLSALEISVSVAMMFLSTEVAILSNVSKQPVNPDDLF